MAATFILHEGAEKTLRHFDLPDEGDVLIIIGPEGGLSRHEVESFKALGDHVKVVTLGSLILRTETAGTVATALCMYGLGGLGAQYFGDDTE